MELSGILPPYVQKLVAIIQCRLSETPEVGTDGCGDLHAIDENGPLGSTPTSTSRCYLFVNLSNYYFVGATGCQIMLQVGNSISYNNSSYLQGMNIPQSWNIYIQLFALNTGVDRWVYVIDGNYL